MALCHALKKSYFFRNVQNIFTISKILSPFDAALRAESIGERIFEIGEIFVHFLKILGLERDIERHGRQAGRPDTFFDPPDRVNGNLKVAIK